MARRLLIALGVWVGRTRSLAVRCLVLKRKAIGEKRGNAIDKRNALPNGRATVGGGATVVAPLSRRTSVGGRATVRVALLMIVGLGWGPGAWASGAWASDAGLDVSQYAHTAWKVRDGFTKGPIHAMAQTPDGYLWLGTEFGLYRFDGVRAVPWQPPAGQQLPSNFTISLLAARDGSLWIGTLKGLASWRDGQLTNYPEVAGQFTARLFQDREQRIWVGTLNPGRLCAVEAGKVQCYGDGSFGPAVNDVYEDRKGNLWVAAETGVWRWKPGPPENYRLPPAAVRANGLAEDDSGTLLIGTSDGLKQLAGGKIQNYALPGVPLMPGREWFVPSKDGSVWLGSPQGLWRLHQSKTETFGAADGLSGNAVISIFEDREGTVWASTTGGLDRFREFAVQTISRSQGLSTNNTYSVQATQDGTIWIATSNGLNRWENGRVTVYGKRSPMGRSGTGGERQLNGSGAVPEVANELANVTTLGLDGQGRLFASVRDGIFYFGGEHFVRVPDAPGGNIWSIAGDGHGKVWVSDGNVGLFYFTPGDAIQPIPWTRFGQEGLGARALLPDPSQGGVWLGFYEGGISYFKDGEVRASYTAANGLGHGRVNRMRFGSRGTLWAATEGGLSRIRDGRVMTLTSKNGLPCDEVHWSEEDDDHFVWVFQPCGLERIARSELDAWVSDPDRKVQLATFDSSDGVPSVGVYGSNGPHITKAPDGKIWFTSNEGVSVIDPRHLPYNKVPPSVQIEQVIADRKTYEVPAGAMGQDALPNSHATVDGRATVGASGSLPLPALSRDLQIDYTALSLVVPEKVLFRYKLEGFDKDWQDVGTRRQAFYTNLPPKNYTFRVMARNNSGVWNEAGTFLDFSVAPAYYQTTWFRLSCVAALLALLWGLYQLRLRQVAQQFNMTLEARVGERTRIARDLHDTLLQSFHGLLLRFQTVSNLLPAGESKQKLDDAIDQAAQAITEGRDAVQGLRSSTTVANDLACAITTLGQELASSETNPNAAEFHVEVNGTPRNLHPILRDEVYRIAGEALRNAFKHAQAQRIEVEIHYDERQLRLRVRDDGKGIDAKHLNEDGRPGHFGLRGMRERAKLMGGKLAVWSELDSGTEVELRIPASRAYETALGRRRSLLAEKLSGKETQTKP